MSPRLWAVIAVAAVPLIVYPLIAFAGGSPRFPSPSECVRPAVEGQPVDVVYGRFDDPVSAERFKDQVVAVGFVGTEVIADGCGRWKVVYEGIPELSVATELQAEARTVDLAPTLERGAAG